MLSRASVGDHVVAVRDVSSPFGAHRVKKGTRGLVVEGPSGIFGPRYKVEFASGGTLLVGSGDLRRATFGHGQGSFRRYKARRRLFWCGLFLLFGLPVMQTVVSQGGADGVAGLALGLPVALLDQVVRLISALGLPLVACLVLVCWLARRLR